MTNQEFLASLIAHIGQRITVTTARHTDETFVELTRVTTTPDGRIWVHFVNGVGLLVTPEDCTIVVEPRKHGSFDNQTAEEIRDTIRRTMFVHGPTQAESNAQCHCYSCESKHIRDNIERLTRISEIYSQAYPEQPAPVPIVREEDLPLPGYNAVPPRKPNLGDSPLAGV